MVHRSIVGSMERAIAHLIEVHGGAFPPWLAPVQVAVLPVSPAEEDRAAGVVSRCLDLGLRTVLAAPSDGTLGARIRAARLVPYQLVVGPREAREDCAAIRLRDGRHLEPQPVADVLERIRRIIAQRGTALWGRV